MFSLIAGFKKEFLKNEQRTELKVNSAGILSSFKCILNYQSFRRIWYLLKVFLDRK